MIKPHTKLGYCIRVIKDGISHGYISATKKEIGKKFLLIPIRHKRKIDEELKSVR